MIVVGTGVTAVVGTVVVVVMLMMAPPLRPLWFDRHVRHVNHSAVVRTMFFCLFFTQPLATIQCA